MNGDLAQRYFDGKFIYLEHLGYSFESSPLSSSDPKKDLKMQSKLQLKILKIKFSKNLNGEKNYL